MRERDDRATVERWSDSAISLGCSRTHQVDRAKPLFRNTRDQRRHDGSAGPYVRILVAPDAVAELVMWEEQATGNVVLFTDPQRSPCIFLAHGDDLRGMGHGIAPEPVLLALRQGGPPVVVPLKGIGTVQWQLAEIERHEDESRHP
jgi:hypothetical protein